MNITQDVITDLLPLYHSAECSADTRALVDEYLKAHPDFAGAAKTPSFRSLPAAIPGNPGKEAELNALTRTKTLLRRRTYFMAFAIFFSLVPISVLHTGGRTYWLFIESPASAMIYAFVGLLLWVGYFITRRQVRGF